MSHRVCAGATPTFSDRISVLCRILVERFWTNFLPPKWMGAVKKNLLGGHVADVVAAQHAAAAMQQAGVGGADSAAATDLTALMKGMVSSSYAAVATVLAPSRSDSRQGWRLHKPHRKVWVAW